jgi:hypothetical protein
MVMPIFVDDGLIAFAAIKAHWLDIGGKDPYSTDTVDVFQEGTVFPGVKLVRRGEIVGDLHRLVIANSRVPEMLAATGLRVRRESPPERAACLRISPRVCTKIQRSFFRRNSSNARVPLPETCRFSPRSRLLSSVPLFQL